ncbi:hypothetical protein C8J56DRAFT_767776 [Mycena floridula]|nr:hypothetical protein C8J56DRAFT_767776 [Mycena floridula]
MTLDSATVPSDSPSIVPLGTGLPSREELLLYYPAKFTWKQLKTFVNSGDLGLLKRDKTLQKRYNLWAQKIKRKYGSIEHYLLNFRLQWGKQDTQSLLTSALDDPVIARNDVRVDPLAEDVGPRAPMGDLPADAPPYFTAQTPPEFISIIQNDWPYSVPADTVEHTLIWTRIPIYHSDIVDPSVAARIQQDGLWGFTGNTSPPPSPSTLPLCLPALAEWGITEDKMIKSNRPTEKEDILIHRASQHVHDFVRNRWKETDWETAWFVNPPRLQSVPGLDHIHVFARLK